MPVAGLDALQSGRSEDCDRLCRSEGIERNADENAYFGIHVPTEFVLKAIMASRVWGPISHEYLNYLMTGEMPKEDRRGWKMGKGPVKRTRKKKVVK